MLVELGWGISGTQRVARQARRNIAQTYAAGLTTQVLVAIPALIAAAIAAFLLAPSQSLTAAVVAVAAGGSISAAWVFVGIAQPRHILLQEAIPRTAAVLAAALALLAGAPLIVYGIALLVAGLLSPALAMRTLGVRRADFLRLSPRRVVFLVRCQSMALTTRVFSSFYISFGTAAVALVAPQATASYAAMDRLLRMAQQVIGTVHFALKGWVGKATTRAERLRRARRAVLTNVVVGLVAGAGFAVVAPVVAEIVFAGVIHIPTPLAAIAGGTLAVIFVSMSCGQILLVTLGRLDALAWSAAAGALVGLPLILTGAALGGTLGALLGQFCAEATVLLVQATAAVRTKRRLDRAAAATAPTLLASE
ncbi:hypothetical protein O159_21630 [Leifsonia xyli subsp. cynodontis DSM 46306]|uniref:Polysaccharide biosynthesis protein C-terminal domain-containing protein n=1 Tax=Leifsonia xyli subsp. cynodontis DSM 46306 TaxID=1389489 RepID=U3P8J3_LEIXC|nr:hypothetical protein [Leifsonia xyli]AGW42141.1 hypothetical protein O159_21630 [Leifsonia xyli subsp. cynodontis DSM 46306]